MMKFRFTFEYPESDYDLKNALLDALADSQEYRYYLETLEITEDSATGEISVDETESFDEVTDAFRLDLEGYVSFLSLECVCIEGDVSDDYE